MFEKIKSYFKPKPENPYESIGFDVEFFENQNIEGNLVAIEIANDDKTPMDFVMYMLQAAMGLDPKESLQSMLKIHVQGTYRFEWLNKDVAIKIVNKIQTAASDHEYPLKVYIASA